MKIELVISHRNEPGNICPPHEFQCAWSVPGETSNGVIYCAYCGSVQSLDLPGVEAPAEERIRQERE